MDFEEDDEYKWKTLEINIHKCALLEVSNKSKEYKN